MKIRFTSAQIAETEGRNRGRSFEAGREYDLPPASARRWLRRGVAVEVAGNALRVDRPMAGPQPTPPADDLPTASDVRGLKKDELRDLIEDRDLDVDEGTNVEMAEGMIRELGLGRN